MEISNFLIHADDNFNVDGRDLQRELHHNAEPGELSSGSFISLDGAVVTFTSISNDEDIIVDLLPDDEDDNNEDGVDDKDMNDPPPRSLSNCELEKVLDKLHYLFIFTSYGIENQSLALKMESLVSKDRPDRLKQRYIADYFQKLKIMIS